MATETPRVRGSHSTSANRGAHPSQRLPPKAVGFSPRSFTKADCTLTVHFESEEDAQQAGLILKRETSFRKRGSAEVRIKNRSITIVIQADDIVAMRATLNTYLRHLQVVGAVSEVAGNR